MEDVIMFDILKVISSKWRDIGLRTGQVNALDGYSRKYLNDDDECVVKVFNVWFSKDGTDNYPITWQGLYNLLCDVGQRASANKIADARPNMGIQRR
jgi:hypothetical protein